MLISPPSCGYAKPLSVAISRGVMLSISCSALPCFLCDAELFVLEAGFTHLVRMFVIAYMCAFGESKEKQSLILWFT